jgi:ATP-dependent 26S proteasome regulatory subunit
MQGNKLETTDTSGSFPQAGLFAIRARRRICEEGDYLKAVEKVGSAYASCLQ